MFGRLPSVTTAGARLLGEFPASGPLGTNQFLSRIQNIPVPADLETGREYWWIVVTEYGSRVKGRAERRKFLLQRNPSGKLRVVFQ